MPRKRQPFKRRRLSIELPPPDFERLVQLTKETAAASMTEVIRRALEQYAHSIRRTGDSR